MRARHLVLLSICAGLHIASGALAQSVGGVALTGDRLRPATTRAGLLDVEWGGVGKHLQLDAALWGSYAHDPVVVYDGADRFALVQHRVGGNVTANLALFDWVELLVDVPVLVMQTGEPAPSSVSSGTIATTGLGDLRLAPKLRILRSSDQLVDVAVIAGFTVPTGLPADAAFVGEGQPTFVPELAISRAFTDPASGTDSGLRLATNLAFRVRPTAVDVLSTTVGNEFVYRAGVGYRFAPVPLELDVTASGAVPVSGGLASTPLEALAGVTWDATSWLAAFAGGGIGVLPGIGVPDVRAFAGLRLHTPGDTDSDDDGIDDSVDACRDVAEDKDGHADDDGCPDDDNDGDGIADASDRCPDVAEDINGYEDTDGCAEGGAPAPVDSDRDGVVDTADACPSVAASTSDGCPPPVPLPEPVPTPPATPVAVPQHILFPSDSAELTSAGAALVDEVAASLRAHDDARVEIAGHADIMGSDEVNQRLSRERAETVRRALVARGIAADRLTTTAHGSSEPVDPGTSRRARAKNRRVVFIVIAP